MRYLILFILSSCTIYRVGNCYHTGFGSYKYKILEKKPNGFYKIRKEDGRISILKPASYDVKQIKCEDL